VCELLELGEHIVPDDVIQSAIENMGGKIDFSLTLSETCYLCGHPEECQEDLMGKKLFLWKSFDENRDSKRILYVWSNNGKVHRCWLGIGSLINGQIPMIFTNPELAESVL